MTAQELLERELRLRGYQYNSIKTYVSCLNTILSKLGENPSLDSIKDFLITINSRNYHKQLTATLHHYFKLVLKKPVSLSDLPYPQKQYTLPDVLSQQEVNQIFSVCNNLKHKAIIALLYGCGLRISEVINLKSCDIHSSRNLIKIVAAKGNRDRYVPLPGELLELLRAYFKAYHPAAPYLFNGQDGAVQYSQRSIGEFIKHYAKKAGIHKRIHAHKFRHSYATHLVEQGTDISLIQKSLGHASQKTTLIYAQISQATISRIPSPLNQISI